LVLQDVPRQVVGLVDKRWQVLHIDPFEQCSQKKISRYPWLYAYLEMRFGYQSVENFNVVGGFNNLKNL
tara:strand:- start:1478 stop:1684 length:207 start_codon:yes stop_codon:yes gene_type:complete